VALKAKLEEAEKAELLTRLSERSSHLKSYTSRFQRPGDSRHSSTNSHRTSSDYRTSASGSSASWRKKDSRFISPNDSEVNDKKVCSDEVRKPGPPTADVKTQQVTRTSETARSQIPTRKASKSCNYFTWNDYYSVFADLYVLDSASLKCYFEKLLHTIMSMMNHSLWL